MSGMVAGLDRKTATVFSFYLSIPIMLAASGLKLSDGFSSVDSISGGVIGLFIGTVVSFAAALASIRWLLKYVQSHSFRSFGYYRILAGILLLIYAL